MKATNEKVGKKLQKTDENTIKGIYTLARKHAAQYLACYPTTYLDIDDLAQEGMIAYLQGRHIKYGILDAIRRSLELKRCQVGKLPIPKIHELSEDDIDVNAEDRPDTALINEIWDSIQQMFDTRTVDIMYRRYKMDWTLQQISNYHSLSNSHVKRTIDRTITIMRRRLG